MLDGNCEGVISRLGAQDYELFLRLKGLSPQGIAKEMCREFKMRFPNWEASYMWAGEGLFEPGQELDSVAYPKGNTWGELEANLKQVARRFGRDDECLGYWDLMRLIWRYFPGDSGQRFRRQVYRQLEKGKSWDEAYSVQGMGMCALCWRATPWRAGNYSRLLCPEHAISSREPEYRRRFRWRYQKDELGVTQFDRIMSEKCDQWRPLKNITKPMRFISASDGKSCLLSMDRAWVDAPNLVISLFPNVNAYLRGLGVGLRRSIEIIMALEAPQPIDETQQISMIREDFYENCSWYLSFYIEHLIAAEVWLALEATINRGGSRKWVGCKVQS